MATQGVTTCCTTRRHVTNTLGRDRSGRFDVWLDSEPFAPTQFGRRMHIKKLEISGFKSFVDKTVIHFDHDVIGIVGPNGCGKSNIVDAIRWCMGEQSAKHLRGRAMEDVIFNGSESRPQHGMAEVTLTFDNSDKEYAQSLPEEYQQYPEIAVTRRLFRDGTSEYLINKTPVRLRDVTDLFLGTGVGTKAYSIVEQGRIGQIVSSRPADRRLYIEEAAGITKYKLRRKQAERKMELTRQNLLRITDIVSEIDRNRGSLKRQAAKAERYIRYRNELEDLFLHDASHRLLEMIVVEQAEARALGAIRTTQAQARERLQGGETKLNEARTEASFVERRYDDATERATTREQQATQCAADAQRAQDRLLHLNERMRALVAEREALQNKATDLEREQAVLQERLTLLDRDEGSQGADAASEDQLLAELKASETATEQRLAETRRRCGALDAELASLRARCDAWQQRQAEVQERRERSAQEIQQSSEALRTAREQVEPLRKAAEEYAAAHATQKQRLEALMTELAPLRPLEQQEAEDLRDLREEQSRKRSRLEALQQLHQALEGVGSGTRSLLSSGHAAVCGMFADRVDVNETYSEAFAALLGERLQCVIVDASEQGLELLEALRQNQQGRASVISKQVSSRSAANPALQADTRVQCFLLTQLQYAPEDAAIVEVLVGDAVVCESAREALEVHRDYGVPAVTMDGTVVRDGGLVCGGSAEDAAASLLEQKRQIRLLSEELAQLDEQVQARQQTHQELRQRIEVLDSELASTQQATHASELDATKAENELTRVYTEVERLNERHVRLSAELDDWSRQLVQFERDAAQGNAEIERLQAERAEFESAVATAEQEAAASKERTAEQAARVTERRIRLAQVREQREAARIQLQRMAEESARSQARLAELQRELSDTAQQQGVTAAQWLLQLEKQQDAARQAKQARRELDEIKALLEQIRTGLGQQEEEIRQLRAQLQELEEAAREHEMRLTKLGLEREHLIQNVRERFRGLELPRVVGDYHCRPAPDAEHRRRIDELNKLIDRMGPVNLDAQHEYEEAEARFTELNDQKVDIEKALAELDRAIKHMDRESKRRFKETFDAVNELFKSTFTRLFAGGRGELRLTDPENILDTGVDIVAQPPGKKLGNIELMSGGEKALTATALIFAIFQYRPSPFCVLDEVDAPLDEANVGRYNDAIRAMTSNSQFVIITHIKKTMQSVDVLYGVTMGEPGVSRLVSVKVNEKAKSRSERAPSALEESATATTQVA